jgi:2,5-furandicarboxylate decarboxylase 1
MTEFPDLHSFLAQIRKELPDQILEIAESTEPDYAPTALAFELERQGRHPILMFRRLKGSKIPLVANMFASRERLAFSVGASAGGFHEHFGKSLDQLIPAVEVKTGQVRENVWLDEEVDLGVLPAPRHFVDDAGRYITAGMVAARDPDTGVGNLAYARLQMKGRNRLGLSLHSRQHLWDYHRRASLAGKDLPVAVVIGAHPAVMVAAAAKMSIEQDEYDLAGALLGKPLPVIKCLTVDAYVPANAEIVIEGYILANEEEKEGPFGEYTGYSTNRSTNNVMRVTAMAMRHDPIFVDIIPGNSAEHLILGRASKEAWVFKRMREALPFFVDFHYPASGTHFHCYIRIDKTAEGQANQAAELLLGLDHYVKLVIVVDKDVDPAIESEVLWSLATRMQANRDLNIFSGVMCNALDPSADNGMGSKLIIDATNKDPDSRRISIPAHAIKKAQEIIAKLS